MQSRIVLTGATGMLGLALTGYAVRRQTEVTAILRKNSKKGCLLPQSPFIRVVESDLDELANLELVLDQPIDTFYVCY